MDRKSDYYFRARYRDTAPSRGNTAPNKGSTQQQSSRDRGNTFTTLQKFLSSRKGAKDICICFNLKEKCTYNSCNRRLVCAKLPDFKQDMCQEKHPMYECPKKGS